MIRKLFPGGKARAVNFSYDDGVVQDLRFVELLNQYGMKGTFNLNSDLLLQGFEWIHPCGMVIQRLPKEQIFPLYQGHEVASHTATHPMMEEMEKADILREMTKDRETLASIFGREIPGFALPFSYHNETIYECTRLAGFEYARISEENPNFAAPVDFYRWRGSKFHLQPELEACVEDFLATDTELAVCQIIGHSYDLDVTDTWERIEAVIQRLSRAEDVWPATHIDIVRYLRQMEMAEITETVICNRSNSDLWFRVDERIILLHPGEREKIK